MPPPAGRIAGARIALVTWDPTAAIHPRFHTLAAPEDAAIAAALATRGVTADRVGWTAEVDWGAYDLIMIRTTWDYFDRLGEFRAWLERAGQRAPLWNPPAVVSWNADKGYLVELEAAGVRLPPTVRVVRGATVDLAALLRERGWAEVVIKRVVTGGAAGQARIAAADVAAGQRHLDGLVEGGDALIQPFLPSIATRGEVSLVAINGQVVHAVRKIPATGDYRSQPTFGARVVRHAPDAAELALATRALAAVAGPTLHARVDLVALDDGAPALMELELIEPYLFLDADPAAVERVADGIGARLAPIHTLTR